MSAIFLQIFNAKFHYHFPQLINGKVGYLNCGLKRDLSCAAIWYLNCGLKKDSSNCAAAAAINLTYLAGPHTAINANELGNLITMICCCHLHFC